MLFFSLLLKHGYLHIVNHKINHLGTFNFLEAGKNPQTAKQQTKVTFGSWMWNIWQCGRFRYQRTRVRIQPSAIFTQTLINVSLLARIAKLETLNVLQITKKQLVQGEQHFNGPAHISNFLNLQIALPKRVKKTIWPFFSIRCLQMPNKPLYTCKIVFNARYFYFV